MKYLNKVRYSVTIGKRANVEKTAIASNENSTHQWKFQIFLSNKDFYPIQWVFVVQIVVIV